MDGKSIKDIARMLGVSKASASMWCRDIRLTEKQIRALHRQMVERSLVGRMMGANANYERRLERLRSGYRRAARSIGALSDRGRFLAGVALYWAEGNRKGRTSFGFANADPLMIAFFLRWLQDCLGVQKKDLMLRILINRIHRSRGKRVLAYWSRITGVPIAQFRRTTFTKNILRKRYENHEKHFGTLHIRVRRGTVIAYRILGSIAVLAGQSERDYIVTHR